MKLPWHSLSIALAIFLSTTTAVRAEPSSSQPVSNYLRASSEVGAGTKEEDHGGETKEKETDEDLATEETITPIRYAEQEKYIEADELYLSGKKLQAASLYRSLKEPFTAEEEVHTLPRAFYQPEDLSPQGSVYWRISGEGLEQQLQSKTLIPLRFLVEQYPEFIPGHLRYARVLKAYEQPELAVEVLERATSMYRNEPELLRGTIEIYEGEEKWLEASILARQFALLNPEHAEAEEFTQLANRQLELYQSDLRSRLRGNAIGSLITGIFGFALTGNLFGTLSALETTSLLLQGESAVGDAFSQQIQTQVPMMKDEAVLTYVREMGSKLASFGGRNEFEYEFHLIMDDQLNAFALPGGKIFINAGALMKTKSEAELAGLLAHEISHAVLSHGFKLVTEGNLTSNFAQFIPFGSTAANLIVLKYSRDMEREADVIGTKILAASGYAADGLRNLTATLNSENENRSRPPAWLSTHPHTEDRVSYLENLIVTNGYDRYAYEGVVEHSKIQEQVAKLMGEYQESDDYRRRRSQRRQGS